MIIKKATLENKNDLLPLIIESQLFQKQQLEKEGIEKIREFKKDTKENFEKWLADKDNVYFIAVEKENIIGFIFLMLDDVVSRTVSLSDIFVLPTKRRRGVAEKLLLHSLEWARENKGEDVVLAVHRDNIPAIKIYKKLGFTEKEDEYLYLKKDL